MRAHRLPPAPGRGRPATGDSRRRLDALRRLCRWAQGTGALAADAARDVRPMRMVRNQQPVGLCPAYRSSAGGTAASLATICSARCPLTPKTA